MGLVNSISMANGVFEIDGDNFDDSDGFVREINRVFVSHLGEVWDGSLDAFHDYLYWPQVPYVIR
jgi:hypothetical protein